MQTLTVFTLHLTAPLALRSQLIGSIGALLQPTRVQPGCLGCRLYFDYDNENAITLIGEWSSRGELTRYLASDVRKTLIAALDLSTEMPQVQIDTIIRKEDLSIIAGLDNSDLLQ
jgi:quinol monooxygenase YgiN